MPTNKELDKYYTSKIVADACIAEMLGVLPLPLSKYHFVEPSAGSGNFLFEHTHRAFDIAPEHPAIEQQDYLLYSEKFPENTVIYGNPPYGSRNKLSRAFIERAISDSNVCAVAFLLPRVFQKHTQQRVFPENWSLTRAIELPDESFTFEGNPYKIPCVFQVWQKDWKGLDIRARCRISFSNEHFTIATHGDVFVMGAAPRTVKMPSEVSTNNRGYWLQCHIPMEEVVENFKQVSWQGNSSAGGGVYWLTKQELIDQYEKHFRIGEHNGQQ